MFIYVCTTDLCVCVCIEMYALTVTNQFGQTALGLKEQVDQVPATFDVLLHWQLQKSETFP